MTVQQLLNRLSTMVEQNAELADYEIVLVHPFQPTARVGIELALNTDRQQVVVDPDMEALFNAES